MKHVIFVGAGPVGLWTAIQIRLLDPEIEVDMFEKYAEYRRNHTLHVEASSLVWSVQEPDFQEMVHHFVGPIRANEMESQLLRFAHRVGVRVHHQEVVDCEELARRYPTANCIVGADGSRSLVRRQVFDDELAVDVLLQHLVQVTYEVADPDGLAGGKGGLSWGDWLKTLKECNHYVQETSSATSSATRITLRIFVDTATYDALSGATLKNPTTLADVEAKTPSLYKTISIWMSAKRRLLNEHHTSAPAVTAIHLDAYRSRRAYTTKPDWVVDAVPGPVWLLVGDAMFGVPFFRSLNDGMICGTILASKIHEFLSAGPATGPATGPDADWESPLDWLQRKMKLVKRTLFNVTVFDEYENYCKAIATWETVVAQMKSTAIDSGLTSLWLGQKILP